LRSVHVDAREAGCHLLSAACLNHRWLHKARQACMVEQLRAGRLLQLFWQSTKGRNQNVLKPYSEPDGAIAYSSQITWRGSGARQRTHKYFSLGL